MMQGFSNVCVAILLQAIYNEGCEEMGLEDTPINRQAYILWLTKTLAREIQAHAPDYAPSGADSFPGGLSGGMNDGLPFSQPPSSGNLPSADDLRDFPFAPPEVAHPMDEDANEDANEEVEVVKDDAGDLDLGDIPMFNSEDFVN